MAASGTLPFSFRTPACTYIVLLLACGLGGCAASSPPVTTGVGPPSAVDGEVAQARAALRSLAEQAVGFSVAVARGDRVIWTEAYGYRDLEGRDPATPATRFRLYSLAKPMTAAAAARLLEARKLDPNAPIQRYVAEFPEKGTPITPMQLATHTSGIRHYSGQTEARTSRHCNSVADALEIFADDPLVHAPGAGETYSSWGFVLLSAVLEGAAEQSYEEAMEDLVFEPVGLTSLVLDDPAEEVPHRTQFYQELSPGTFSLASEVDNTCKWGAGAWLGTAADVAQFGLALIDDSFLSSGTQQLFLRGQPTYRAQGVGVGGTAFLVVDDARDLSIALLANTSGETAGPMLQDAVRKLEEVFAGER